MSKASIQSLIEQVRNETQLHGNTRERIASLLTQLNSEKLDRADVESIISEITNISPLFFDQFGNILSSLTQGWTEQTAYEADGTRLVKKITGYTGATGTIPEMLFVNIGKYYKADGTLTTVKAEGANFRGDVGQAIINNNTYNLDPDQIVSSEALYNDATETLAGDIIKRVDINTGENVNYRETTTWHDGRAMDDTKVDGVIYVKKVNKYYKRQYESSINIRWFGAKGDGVDDTESIITAFSYLFKLKEEGIKSQSIYFPKGVYVSITSLFFPTGVDLIGESQSSTEIFFKNITNGIVLKQNKDLPNDFEQNSEYSSIKDISIKGHYKDTYYVAGKPHNNNLDCNGIVMSKVLKVNFTNISIAGFESSGILFSECYYINLNNCYIFNNKIGVVISNVSTTILATNCEIRWNSIGVMIDNSFSNKFINCLIETNIATYNPPVEVDADVIPKRGAGVGVFFDNGAYANTFDNCYFEGHIIGFYFNGGVHSNIISKCFLAPNIASFFDPNITYLAKFEFAANYNCFIENNHEGDPGSMPLRCTFEPHAIGNTFKFISKSYYDRFFVESGAIIDNAYAANGLRENSPYIYCEASNQKFFRNQHVPYHGIYACTSSQRNVQPTVGMQVLNIDTNKINTFNGTDWVNPDGTIAI